MDFLSYFALGLILVVVLIIGFLHQRFIHVPIELLAGQTKRLDPASGWWSSVLAATGQPERFH